MGEREGHGRGRGRGTYDITPEVEENRMVKWEGEGMGLQQV